MGLLSLLLAAVIIAVVAVAVLPKQLNLFQPKFNEPGSTEQVSPLGFQKSQTQAQLTAMQFMNALRDSFPPISDLASAKKAKALLTSQARLGISDNPKLISGDLARFAGIQDISDQGYRVEGVKSLDENTVLVTIGFYYSGSGQVARSVKLLFENGAWKIDSFSSAE